MLRGYQTVQAIASVVADAGETAIQAYRDSRVTDEPHITDRLMGAIETAVNFSRIAREYRISRAEAVDSDSSDGVVEDTLAAASGRRLIWRAMTLRAGSRSAAQEKRFGADVLGVLSVETPSYRVSKGFLAQAKRAEPGVKFSTAEWRRLQGQCEVMLGTTPDAYAMIYSKVRGVRLVSAGAIVSFSGRDVFELYDLGLRTFFEKHIESFIGDRRLNRPEIAVLDGIRASVPSDDRPSVHVLHLKASLSE